MSSKLPKTLPLLETAFFFDFDGTLVELAPTPDSIQVTAQVHTLLHRLFTLSGGAVALVSGRSIDTLDTLLTPLRLPMAGVHGAERRNAQGELSCSGGDLVQLEQMANALTDTMSAHPGMLLELKGPALSLHFRHVPHLEPLARAVTEQLVERYAEHYVLQPGKMVFEIKPRNVDKGKAIQAFLTESPFAGRTPFFVGDDLTDEAGFTVVNEHGGWSVKVGSGSTRGRARIDSVPALLMWLTQVLDASSA